MKNRERGLKFLSVVLVVLAISLASFAGFAETSDTSSLLTDALTSEREAIALYTAIIDEYGSVQPFTNLLEAALNHERAIERLFDYYGLLVPPETTVTAEAPDTLELALNGALTLERAQEDLYANFLSLTDDSHTEAVVTQILKSSTVHIESVQSCLDSVCPVDQSLQTRSRTQISKPPQKPEKAGGPGNGTPPSDTGGRKKGK